MWMLPYSDAVGITSMSGGAICTSVCPVFARTTHRSTCARTVGATATSNQFLIALAAATGRQCDWAISD
jgi:hypothetical protein